MNTSQLRSSIRDDTLQSAHASQTEYLCATMEQDGKKGD